MSPFFKRPGSGRAKCIHVFRPKRRKNPTRRGGTYLYSLYKGAPPPRAPSGGLDYFCDASCRLAEVIEIPSPFFNFFLCQREAGRELGIGKAREGRSAGRLGG